MKRYNVLPVAYKSTFKVKLICEHIKIAVGFMFIGLIKSLPESNSRLPVPQIYVYCTPPPPPPYFTNIVYMCKVGRVGGD